MTMLPVFAGFTAVFLGTAYPQNATPRKPASQPIYNTAPALADFQKRVQEYALLHLRVAKQIGGPLDPTKSPKEIAVRQGQYERHGWEALLEGHRSGRPKELTSAQRSQLDGLIDSGPIAYGFSSGVWTSPM